MPFWERNLLSPTSPRIRQLAERGLLINNNISPLHLGDFSLHCVPYRSDDTFGFSSPRIRQLVKRSLIRPTSPRCLFGERSPLSTRRLLSRASFEVTILFSLSSPRIRQLAERGLLIEITSHFSDEETSHCAALHVEVTILFSFRLLESASW
jgi:hypothetical protein